MFGSHQSIPARLRRVRERQNQSPQNFTSLPADWCRWCGIRILLCGRVPVLRSLPLPRMQQQQQQQQQQQRQQQQQQTPSQTHIEKFVMKLFEKKISFGRGRPVAIATGSDEERNRRLLRWTTVRRLISCDFREEILTMTMILPIFLNWIIYHNIAFFMWHLNNIFQCCAAWILFINFLLFNK